MRDDEMEEATDSVRVSCTFERRGNVAFLARPSAVSLVSNREGSRTASKAGAREAEEAPCPLQTEGGFLPASLARPSDVSCASTMEGSRRNSKDTDVSLEGSLQSSGCPQDS